MGISFEFDNDVETILAEFLKNNIENESFQFYSHNAQISNIQDTLKPVQVDGFINFINDLYLYFIFRKGFIQKITMVSLPLIIFKENIC